MKAASSSETSHFFVQKEFCSCGLPPNQSFSYSKALFK
jgi:hypothetical protein